MKPQLKVSLQNNKKIDKMFWLLFEQNQEVQKQIQNYKEKFDRSQSQALDVRGRTEVPRAAQADRNPRQRSNSQGGIVGLATHASSVSRHTSNDGLSRSYFLRSHTGTAATATQSINISRQTVSTNNALVVNQPKKLAVRSNQSGEQPRSTSKRVQETTPPRQSSSQTRRGKELSQGKSSKKIANLVPLPRQPKTNVLHSAKAQDLANSSSYMSEHQPLIGRNK